MRRRWDTDERGHGTTDGSRFAPDVAALADAMATPLWIAEEPEVHLLPHLQRHVTASDGIWALDGWRDENGLLELTLHWRGSAQRRLRFDAFALIASIVEGTTLVAERVEATETVFDVTTGAVADDGPFAPHGHLLRLRVRQRVRVPSRDRRRT